MSQNHKQMRSLFVLICLTSGLSVAYANESPLIAKMEVFHVDQKQQKKLLKADEQVKPKQALEYQVSYENVSQKSLKNLKLNLPLPQSVTYLGQSFPKGAQASLDGKNFAPTPLTRLQNGKQVNIPLNEYRALQWHITELKPKQKISVSAQVRVNTSE